jgi:hypothetical protein
MVFAQNLNNESAKDGAENVSINHAMVTEVVDGSILFGLSQMFDDE